MPAPPSQAGQAASSLENRILSPTGGLLSVTSLNVDKGPASAAADPRSSSTRRGVTVPLPHALGGDAPPESGPPKFISPHGRTVGRGVKSVKSEAHSKEGDTDDTEPLFQPHPTDTWVLRYLEAFTTDDLNLRKQFDTTGQQFLARYQALVRKGGPVSDLSPALHGLSLLLACRNPIRSSAAATAASVMRLVSTADTSVMTALFSYARDLTISVIAAGEVGDEFDSDVLAAVQTVALRLAGAHLVGALEEYDDRDLAHFSDQCTLLRSATDSASIFADNLDMAASLCSALTAFETLRSDPPPTAETSVGVAISAVQRHHSARDASGRGGGEGLRKADAEAILAAIDLDVSSDRFLAAELGLRLLALLASFSVAALSSFMRGASERLCSGAWPELLAYVYCDGLACVALAGRSSKIRKIIFDPSAVGSLATAGEEVDWTRSGDLGEDAAEGEKLRQETFRWAVIRGLLAIKFGGTSSIAYSWLTDAAAESLAARPDVKETGHVCVALERRARAHASLLCSGCGPFGLENTLCSTSAAVAASQVVKEDPIELPPVAPPAPRVRSPSPRKPIEIRKRSPTKLTPRVDVVTRNANGLRLLLGAQVLKEQERDFERRQQKETLTT
eukprot:m.106725 g.106725  ORF g.106725 m.106725 type:complete len:620 (-) comp12717_c1_seq1:95-1954(-)